MKTIKVHTANLAACICFIFMAITGHGQSICTVDGITITTTGTTSSPYSAPTANPDGCVASPFTGNGAWSGNTATGTVTHLFSLAVTSVRVSYTAVNAADIQQFSTDTGGTLTLTDACNATILSGNRIQGVADYTDSWITITSTIPFTTLIGTNVGGSSGWVQGTICDIAITPACDSNDPTLDCDGDGFTNDIDCNPFDPNKNIDTDNDGVCDEDDLDADNDGILNSDEGCVSVATDLTSLTFNGTTVQSTTANSITTVSNSAWTTSYSDQSFDLPLRLSFTTGASSNMFLGILPNGATQTLNTWNDGALKVYFNGNRFWGKLPSTWNPSSQNKTNSDVFVIEIDIAGILTLTQNGITRFTGPAPVSSYQIAVTSFNTATFSNIEFTHANSFSCADSDNDGTDDYLDLDSDNDGCSDANEAYNDSNADGSDDAIYGFGSPSVNSDGTVIAASYATPNDSEPNGIPDFQQAGPLPTISTQPLTIQVIKGNNGNLTVAGANIDGYQWERSIDGGATFTSITDGIDYSGTLTANLTILNPDIDKNGYIYRAVLSNNAVICDGLISDSATLNMRLSQVITNRRITYRIRHE